MRTLKVLIYLWKKLKKTIDGKASCVSELEELILLVHSYCKK
jgi:hypothetical protein